MRNTIETVDWIQLQKDHDSGVSWYKLGVSTKLLKKAEKLGMIINRKIRQKLTDSTKKKMSILDREFGRGTDFICSDKEVDAQGGTLVI